MKVKKTEKKDLEEEDAIDRAYQGFHCYIFSLNSNFYLKKKLFFIKFLFFVFYKVNNIYYYNYDYIFVF